MRQMQQEREVSVTDSSLLQQKPPVMGPHDPTHWQTHGETAFKNKVSF